MPLSRKVSLVIAFFLPLLFLVGRILIHDMHLSALPLAFLGIQNAQAAEREDDEFENEDEDNEEEHAVSTVTPTNTETSKKKSSKPIYKLVTEYQPVTKTVSVIEPGYEKDSDGDSLLDAIDPHPDVDERGYFTDDDSDSVPNALDQHPNEDDFSYLDDETDTNHDGLVDAYQ